MMRCDELRAALYHRFHWLMPVVAHPAARRLWRLLVWGFWLAYFCFVAAVLVLRYSVLPNIEQYRPDIERLATQAVGQRVSIGRIEASWAGVNPDLTLLDVSIADDEGQEVLGFSRVEAVLSWWSVPSARLKLRLLRIEEPTLNLRRDAEGRLFVAGVAISSGSADGGVADWVLSQRRIRISGATLIWEDELRGAPPLILEDLSLALDNDGDRHRFGLTAQPPEALASRIDVRGDLEGGSLEALDGWEGRAYAEIDYIDLAVWQKWIDYPVALPRGRGALRSWLSFADGRLSRIAADVSLRDVRLQLAGNLPTLELDRMSGRIGAGFSGEGFEVSGRRIEMNGHPALRKGADGASVIRIEPTDFRVAWNAEPDGGSVAGSASASVIDIDALSALSAYIPFDAWSRGLLNDYAPRGRISNLKASWKGDAERLERYSLSAGFDDLALRAQGYFPGFTGISGMLEATEKGGNVTLRSKKSSIDLPSVFPEPRIEFEALSAAAKWKLSKGVLDLELNRIDFAGPDATGSAQGSYRNAGSGPGVIDLSASLTRADARAVWRYMPHAVGEGARHWLRDSLISGVASEAKLTLKGNLDDFPFLDKRKGQFLVTVKARDVTLDYANGWPQIIGIDGDLRFEGNGMTVDAQRGSILGAKLSHTRAEIPDFDKPVSTITIKGKADGPTSEFLAFIEKSPVGDRIDHFTEDMRATGDGHLDIDLFIPLDEAHLGESTLSGTYRLQNNELTIDSGLPPFRQVSGTVSFTGNDLRIPEIDATFLGGPLKIKGGTQKDGRVLITANGSLNIAQLRKQSPSPLLAHFAGSAPYRGEVRINKRNADLVIDSNLVGLSSALPAPLGKMATEVMPVRFEKKLLPGAGAGMGAAARDQISGSLGSVLSAQIIRRKQDAGFVVERGNIAVGRPVQLPERGLSFSLTSNRLDIDQWRKLLSKPPAKPGALPPVSLAPADPFLDAINVRAAELILLGRRLNDVDLTATVLPAQWKFDIKSQQVTGNISWDTAGRGKLTARLSRFVADPAATALTEDKADLIEELPGMDLVAEEFSVGARRFGRLELVARNVEGNVWKLDKIQMGSKAGIFTGSGHWQISKSGSYSSFDFKLDSTDVGKLLDGLGYPGTIRGGTAQLSGKVAWDGAPTALDYASLTGDMALEANKGQFLKLDAGAGGKLLGLLSLQGLPRRITLDFKDVFSDGFAFDSVESKFGIQNGVMHTDRLQIDGPSARVVMRGEIDLKRETQRLNVNVQPELGGTAALGVALINPVAGVATWVAHKALQNPLNHMFGFDYLVTGSWSDPKVEKLSGGVAPAPAPRLPTIPTIPGISTTPPGGAANEPVTK